MAIAIRINLNSNMEEIEVNDIIETIQTQTHYPHREYRLLERYEYDNLWLYVYGMLNLAYPFNQYNFQLFNMTGDVFALLVNETGDFVDLTIRDFVSFYEEVDDLDDYLIEDEMEEYSEIDEYTYDDGFLVRDSDTEMVDFNRGWLNG